MVAMMWPAVPQTTMAMAAKLPEDHAVALGVTCEACHNGARLHAESSTSRRRASCSKTLCLASSIVGGAESQASRCSTLAVSGVAMQCVKQCFVCVCVSPLPTTPWLNCNAG